MFGTVTDASSGRRIPGATIDVWQASTNGLYEQQDCDQPDFNLRGRYKSNEEGVYALRCLRPTPYPIPGDGPAGKLLDLLDRHHYRPGHIHVMITAEGYKSITTQVFDAETDYLEDDSVFAVKDGLTVHFKQRQADEKSAWELNYNISMAKL